MRCGFKLALVLAMAAGVPLLLRGGEIIDGIVATVNGVAILQSDVDEAARCEALLENRSPNAITPVERRAVLERLIDQELLRQQMANTFPPPKPEEVAQRILQVRRQTGGAGSDEGWQTILKSYGLSEEQVAERIAAQMQIAAFVDLHLQGGMQVDRASVRVYYEQKLLPALRLRGARSDPPLSEVSGQIEQILRQQREDELLTSWLGSLRQQSRIRTGAGISGDEKPAPGQELPAGNSK